MLRFIERTRRKSKSARDRYAFFGALAFTCVVAIVWAVSLPSKFDSLSKSAPEEQKEDSSGAFAKFFGEVRTQVASVFHGTDAEPLPEEETVKTNASVAIPTLHEETLRELQGRKTATDTPQPRTVLIATTSQNVTISSSTHTQ